LVWCSQIADVTVRIIRARFRRELDWPRLALLDSMTDKKGCHCGFAARSYTWAIARKI